MLVQELKLLLSQLPQNAEVRFVYDGAARGIIDHVYVSKCGMICIASQDEHLSPPYDHHRPCDAPSKEEELHYCLPRVRFDNEE